jgi:hypothetical protein
MAKKFNSEKLNLQSYVDYDLEESYNCQEEGCDDEGICRCSVIDDVKIQKINAFQIAEEIVSYLTFGKRNFSTMGMESGRIILEMMNKFGIEKPENYSWESQGDYYGEIVSGIYFDKMQDLLNEMRKFLHK